MDLKKKKYWGSYNSKKDGTYYFPYEYAKGNSKITKAANWNNGFKCYDSAGRKGPIKIIKYDKKRGLNQQDYCDM